MLRDVVWVKPLSGYRLQLKFDDGLVGEIDVSQLVSFDGVFAPLRDLEFFRQVTVDPELRVVCWPNHADLDSDVLYSEITKTPLPASKSA